MKNLSILTLYHGLNSSISTNSLSSSEIEYLSLSFSLPWIESLSLSLSAEDNDAAQWPIIANIAGNFTPIIEG